MMRRSPVVIALATAAAVLGAVAGTSGAASSAPSSPPHFSVLSAGPLASDNARRALRSGVRIAGFEPSTARFIGSHEGINWYLAPYQAQGVCLMSIGNGITWTCARQLDPKHPTLWFAQQSREHTQLVSALVPDGYTALAVSGSKVKIAGTGRNLVLLTQRGGAARLHLAGAGQPNLTVTFPNMLRETERLARRHRR